MKRYSIVVPDDSHQVLFDHLKRTDEQEDLCFATYVPSTSHNRLTALVTSVILPCNGERIIHGNVGFLPKYLERVLRIARERKEGLVFIHVHQTAGWQGMSDDDIAAEIGLAPSVYGALKLPLVGMTMGTDGAWSGRFWKKKSGHRRIYEIQNCESVRVVGEKLRITFNDELLIPHFDIKKQLRTISAWGQSVQEDLSRLKVGIVGLGSVGSIVADILAKTGFSNFVLIDFDTLEEKNLDRTAVSGEFVGLSKVEAIKKMILKVGTSPSIDVETTEYSVCEKEGYMKALDCDVIFSCVDRPWPRQVLNFISYVHLIPVIDGGILVRTNSANTGLIGADWKTQTIGYQRPCLECSGQYKTANAILEKEGKFDDPSYIAGSDIALPIEVHENVYPFSSSLASFEVMQLLNMLVMPKARASGQQTYHFSIGQLEHNKNATCFSGCYFPTVTGQGDFVDVQVYDTHKLAEQTRKIRAQPNR